jgi:hypothetical protein
MDLASLLDQPVIPLTLHDVEMLGGRMGEVAALQSPDEDVLDGLTMDRGALVELVDGNGQGRELDVLEVVEDGGRQGVGDVVLVIAIGKEAVPELATPAHDAGDPGRRRHETAKTEGAPIVVHPHKTIVGRPNKLPLHLDITPHILHGPHLIGVLVEVGADGLDDLDGETEVLDKPGLAATAKETIMEDGLVAGAADHAVLSLANITWRGNKK